jgi:N-acetylglucosamine kinase-like BadF-type ATPase
VLEENGTKAVMNHYDVKDNLVAKSIATENLTKPYIVEAIENKRKSLKEALIEKGIDEKKIADKINVLLDATIGENEKPDVNAIDKGLKHAKEIYGVEDSDKPKENVYNFFFEPKFQQNIKNYDQNLKEQILNKDAE